MINKIKLNLVLLILISLFGACAAPRFVSQKKAPPSYSTAKTDIVTSAMASRWQDVPGWQEDDLIDAWRAFLISCHRAGVGALTVICQQAKTYPAQHSEDVRQFFETHFLPYQLTNTDGSRDGLITGYYEPLLLGSRVPSERYRYPLYKPPHPTMTYFSREQIDGAGALLGYELLWVDDLVDLFFLHIQGSGRVALESGEVVRAGYAGQNGHPYVAIGKLLIEDGELAREEVNLPAIKAWLRRNPSKTTTLLNRNPSYVFFRELPSGLDGPIGALGAPLTAGRSIAVDPGFIPLGVPVFLDTTWPTSTAPLRRLTIAQDTGGAIKGAVRADLFWGFGLEAETYAGHMKETGRLWVLLPRS